MVCGGWGREESSCQVILDSTDLFGTSVYYNTTVGYSTVVVSAEILR